MILVALYGTASTLKVLQPASCQKVCVRHSGVYEAGSIVIMFRPVKQMWCSSRTATVTMIFAAIVPIAGGWAINRAAMNSAWAHGIMQGK